MYHLEEDKLLTERELEVLLSLHEGLSNPQISERLYITIHTVKAHLSKIFRKLGAKNRTDVLLMLVGEKEIPKEIVKKQIKSLNNNAFAKVK